MTDWSKRSDAGIIVGNSFCEWVVRLHILCKRSGLCVKHQGQMGKQGSGSLLYLRCYLENGRSTGTTDAEPHSLMDGANGSLLYLRCYLYTGRSTEKMGHRSNSRDTLLAALDWAIESTSWIRKVQSSSARWHEGHSRLGD